MYFRHYAIILVIAVVMFFLNLGVPKLWDIDEPRNAGCAAEMIAANDWVTPVFNGELRVHKPVLLYWFMIAAYKTFGVTEFAARFFSALLGLGTVLMTYHIARRLMGASVGLWSAIVLASTLSFVIAARAATPDSVLIFFTTAATLVYVLGTFKPRVDDESPSELRVEGRYFPQSWPVVALMYGLMGVACLAKGPVGLVLPTAVIGMFLLIKRLPPFSELGQAALAALRYRMHWPVRFVFDTGLSLRAFGPRHFLKTCWAMRPITAIAMVLLVAGPWYYWVGLRTDGEWLRGFFLEHNVQRAATAMEGHGGPIYYYVGAMLAFLFPWSVFATPIVIDLAQRFRRRDAWRDGLVLAACWVCVYVGLFSLASTKLPSYISPMYPAAAIVIGAFFVRWSRGEMLAWKGWSYVAAGVLAAVGLVLAVTLPIVAHIFTPGEEWLGLLGVVPLVGAGVFTYFHWKGRSAAAARTMAATSVLFAILLFGVASVRVSRHQSYDALADAIRDGSDNPSVVSFGCLEPSWVFYTERTISHIKDNEADLPELERFLQEQGDDGFVITTRERYDATLRDALAGRVSIVGETPYFLKDETLVVLQARDVPTIAGAPTGGAIR